MKNTICIIQPGRAGDILITLPIAYHYYKKGFDIIWPVASEYIDIFSNVSFLENMFIYNIGSISEHNGSTLRSFAKEYRLLHSEILDLAIGFGNSALDKEWKTSGLSFDTWKYFVAKLEYQIKYSLPNFIIRDRITEKKLMDLKNIKPGEKYIVIHENKSNGRKFKFSDIIDFQDYKIIRITESEGYNIFSWLSILEGAYKIFCVDSVFLNLVDQFNIIPKGGRFFHPWIEFYDPKIFMPKINDDWKIIT